jgi:hypothetical protein
LQFDKTTGYSIGEAAVVTVTDQEANTDDTVINTEYLLVTSTTDTIGIILTLTETEPDSGEFTGSFTLSSDPSSPLTNTLQTQTGDSIVVAYGATHPRVQATVSGVAAAGTEATPGTATLSEYALTSDQQELLEFKIIGEPVLIDLDDTVQLLPFDQGGKITTTLSYANAPLDGQTEGGLTVYLGIPLPDGSIDWHDLCAETGTCRLGTNSITVDSYSEGIFTIGVFVGGGGGGGGGLAFGGGLVVDLTASVVGSSSGGGGTTTPPGSGGGGTTTPPGSGGGGTTTPPGSGGGGTTAAPGGTTAAPGGTTAAPGGTTAAPASSTPVAATSLAASTTLAVTPAGTTDPTVAAIPEGEAVPAPSTNTTATNATSTNATQAAPANITSSSVQNVTSAAAPGGGIAELSLSSWLAPSSGSDKIATLHLASPATSVPVGITPIFVTSIEDNNKF